MLCRESAVHTTGFVRTTIAHWAHMTEPYARGDSAMHVCTRHNTRHAPSSLVATKLSSSSVHYDVHCLGYYSLALFMGTVHGHCTHEISESNFQSERTQKKNKK